MPRILGCDREIAGGWGLGAEKGTPPFVLLFFYFFFSFYFIIELSSTIYLQPKVSQNKLQYSIHESIRIIMWYNTFN